MRVRRDQPHLIPRRDLAQAHGPHSQQPLHLALEQRDQVLFGPGLRHCASKRGDDLLHRRSVDSGGRQRGNRARCSTILVAHGHSTLRRN